MNYQLFAAFLVASTVGVSAQQATTPVVPEGTEMTLTGCVVKGDGGYVLSTGGQSLSVQTMATTAGTKTNPTAASINQAALATVPAACIFYWLQNDDAIKDFAGQVVELKGTTTGDLSRGEIEVEIEQGMVELEFKVDGRQVIVKVPSAEANTAVAGTSGMVTSAPVGKTKTSADRPVGTSSTTIDAKRATGVTPLDKPEDVAFVVRKVNVQSVKSLAPTCNAVR
jgi:hypothetical protein